MSSCVTTTSRRLHVLCSGTGVFFATGAFLLTLSVASAQEPVPAMLVEEDWKVVLNEPDNNLFSPQFHTVMSPYDDLDSFYVQVTWNYRELPDFQPGGFQVQQWEGDQVQHVTNMGETPFSSVAETITWTQVLATNGEHVAFAVVNGQSSAWGTFASHGVIVGYGSGVADLSRYSTAASIQNSCVTYGSNRIALLMITEVRYFDADGELLCTDSEPKVLVTTGEQ